MTIVLASKNNCIQQSGYKQGFSANSLATPLILLGLILCRVYLFWCDKRDRQLISKRTKAETDVADNIANRTPNWGIGASGPLKMLCGIGIL